MDDGAARTPLVPVTGSVFSRRRFTATDNLKRMTTYGSCLRCGEELRHGDWVIQTEEIRKLVVDPENVPDGVAAHKDCIIHTLGA